MKNYFSFSLVGAKELIQNLDDLPKSFQKPVLRRAIIKALAPVLAAAEALAGSTVRMLDGRYKLSYAISTKLTANQARQARQRRAVDGIYAVTVYVGSNDPKAHLLEFGHRIVTRLGNVVGTARPFPVMRPAWDGNKEAAFNIFLNELSKELLSTVRRLGRRAQKGKLTSRQKREILYGD